jgi:hypothetical protein
MSTARGPAGAGPRRRSRGDQSSSPEFDELFELEFEELFELELEELFELEFDELLELELDELLELEFEDEFDELLPPRRHFPLRRSSSASWMSSSAVFAVVLAETAPARGASVSP